MLVNCCWYNKGNAGRPVLLLKEKPLQYYKLLCRLASESREADRLTLQVKNHKTRGLGSGILDQKICQDLPPPRPPLILMVEIKTWHSLIPKAMYKNLVVYELFSPKGQNDWGYIYIYIYILGHSSLFYLFPIEKLVVTCQARIYYITCIPIWINKIPHPGSNWNLERLLWEGMMVKREKMEYQFQDKYFLEQSRELTTISVMTKLDWTIFWANACTI